MGKNSIKLDVIKIASEQRYTKQYVIDYLDSKKIVFRTDGNGCPCLFLTEKDAVNTSGEKIAAISNVKFKDYNSTTIAIDNKRYYVNKINACRDVYHENGLFNILTAPAIKIVENFIDECANILIQHLNDDSDSDNDTSIVFTIK